MNKKLRVSLVIPAYNEERHLRQCLDAVVAQSVRPFEVILVDNNSSDKTIAIAQEYPFVRIIREPHQGVVFARDAGFDAARGDIIGRIDADTVIDVDWVETVQTIFTESDIDALSGAVRSNDMALTRIASWVDLQCRRYLANRLGREVYLFGSNMAIRRSAWWLVKTDVCNTAGIHEDFDLAIHLNRRGCRVVFNAQLYASISVRRVDTNLVDFFHYAMKSPRTYAVHRIASRRYMYPVVILALCCYLPVRALYRGFDPARQQFSWRRIFTTPSTHRVDPTLHHETYL